MKTSDVKALAQEALATLPQPYSEHVIDEVFAAIESEPRWLRDYEALCARLSKTVVNNWLGRWIGIALGKVGEKQVPSTKSSLISSYSLLDTDAKPVERKPNEGEALKMMADYFSANKSHLPPDVRKYREIIVELIMEGLLPEEAFAVGPRRGT
jgi:hypothetical protein